MPEDHVPPGRLAVSVTDEPTATVLAPEMEPASGAASTVMARVVAQPVGNV